MLSCFRQKTKRASRGRRHRPVLELLEDRTAPATFHVSLSGSDASTGGVADPFRTIQRAVTAAADAADGDDTIRVEAGVYNAPGVDLAISIPSSLNIANLVLLGGFNIGSGFSTRTPRTTVYVPQSPGNINVADVDVLGAVVTFDGFYFVFDGMIGSGGARQSGGLLSRGTDLTLNNNQFESPSSSGAGAFDAYAVQTAFGSDQSGLRITNNVVHADAVFSSGGIYINPGVNTRTECMPGIGGPVCFLVPIRVANNTISGANLSQGIAVDTMSHVTLSNNNLSRTVANGLQLIFAGPFNGNANQDGIVISGNTVDSNDTAGSIGIEVGNTNTAAPFSDDRLLDVQLLGNIVRDNATGIAIDTNVGTATLNGGQLNSNATGLVANRVSRLNIVDIGLSGNTVDGTLTDIHGSSTDDGINYTVTSGPQTFNGRISEVSGTTTFTKLGPGDLLLAGGPNNLVAVTRVRTGRLFVHVEHGSLTIEVHPGATLGGDGTVGTLSVFGTVAPNTTLTSGAAFFEPGSTFQVVALGTLADLQYDRLRVTTRPMAVPPLVVLREPTLEFFLGFEAPVGSEFMIIQNDGSEPVQGQFHGLPEGATFGSLGFFAGRSFRITYVGGDGNDVVVTRIDDPVFVFAIGAADLQVYVSQADAVGQQADAWMPTAPGQFLDIVVSQRVPCPGSCGSGPNVAPLVFGLGLDHQIYAALFNNNGTLHSGWFLVAPGFFDDLAVTSNVDFGGFGSGEHFLFAVGTESLGGRQVFEAEFDSFGTFVSGWAPVAPGQFESIVAETYGAGNPEVFGVGVDDQVYAARFDADGDLVNGWFHVAPGAFASLAVAGRPDGSLELFGLGLDGRAFAANFNASGNLAHGWFPVHDRQPQPFTQIVASALAGGNLSAFGLGTDAHAYQATFGTGNQATDWSQLSADAFRFLAAGSQRGNAKLFAINAGDFHIQAMIFDESGAFNSGFFPLADGEFTVVAVAT